MLLYFNLEAQESCHVTNAVCHSNMSQQDCPGHIHTIQVAFDLGLIKEEWDRDTWHNGCYLSGIPPFDSDDFLLKLWTGLNGAVSLEYEQDFNDKLMQWVGDGDR